MDAAEVSDALTSGELHLSGRQLLEVPQFVFACCGLLVLDLSANSLDSLPVALSELKRLTWLDVSFNQLREVPACLGSLTALTCLRANYNQIERLHPQALVGLSGCLRELHLGDNALTPAGLPAQVGCLTRLAHLDLRYNHSLNALPPELGNLVAPLASEQDQGAAARDGAELPKAVSAGGGGCLNYLCLEGCPLGEGCADVSSKPGTVVGSESASVAAQQQARKALYQRLQAAAAAVEASENSRIRRTSVEARESLAEALLHLQRLTAPRQLASSDATVHLSEDLSSAALAGVADAGRELVAMATAPIAAGGIGVGASANGRVDVFVLRPVSGGAGHNTERRMASTVVGDLRNSHADLELSYMDGDEEDGDTVSQGINIIGPESGVAGQPPLSPGDSEEGQGAVAAALASALEELSGLPPAAAAAMYRSLDMVAAGVQEMREGRPLSRGGSSHSHPGKSATMDGAETLAFARTATAISRSPSHQQRRPGSGSLKHGSSAGSNYSHEPFRPRTSSIAASRPGSTAGRGQDLVIINSSHQQLPLTGAIALLASSGMGPAAGQGEGCAGGGNAWRLLLGAPAAQASSPTGGSDGDRGGLGSLAPITFPLASGVRGMLRGATAATKSARPPPVAAALHAVGMPVTVAEAIQYGSGGAVTSVRIKDGGPAGGGPGDGVGTGAEGVEDAMLAAELDRLAVVRRLLAGRNPELVRVLDYTVFGEEERTGGESGAEG